MKLRNVYLVLALLGIPLLFWKYPIALGWTIGHLVMFVLEMARLSFYSKVMNSSTFRMSQYFAYVLVTICLIAGPLFLSFIFRDVIEPLAIFAAYFTDRILTFVFNIFKKENVNHAS